ncbi:MAG: hypothetical protein DIZ80_10180 [endosymbiont of Galathealinum brachiosum]|uniref:Uncharacterized protein n=1 Tax=endosymbiont of Galathealinum brachiosum TaxID=2200906 RepID=A0A370DCK8_9GAMM|nr:MAG: hypothetical protein DIZ80_10180 [endosymbiont of Galathealinum brachiosum]
MSLLLDALKKAADDKNKNSDTSTNDASENKHESIKDNSNDSLIIDEQAPVIDETIDDVVDDSLELELEFEPDAETTENNSEKNEAFPEVDDSINISTSGISTDEELTDQLLNNNELDDLEDSPLELSETVENRSNEDKKEETNSTEVTSDSEDILSEKTEEIEQGTVDTAPELDLIKNVAETKQQSASVKVENEQALSALINKSNQYSRSEKLKKNITIGILILLIMIGSGLYFYIEIQTSSQDLYITQNSNAAINRNLNTPTPVTAQKAAPLTAPKQQEAKPAQSTVQIKPQARTPVALKSQVTKPATNKTISIVRTKRSDPIHVLLRDAYDAFHNQDYRQSEKLYKKVLKQESKNRDAYLGLAAIGTKEQRYEYARQKYQYLLKLNPRDSLATAGLSSLENQVSPQLSESQIKFMLKQQPDSAHLYFALGTLYSKQGRWPEAQSSYFSAWSAENKTADYAYNLAVSLDHLDKKKQALDFYQLSIKLKKASSGNFSQVDTENRIRSLRETLK